MKPAIKGILTAFNSERDRNGNTYWAFTYVDTLTGRKVSATVSGGESNIYAVLRYSGVRDEWDRSIHFQRITLPKREFQRLVKEWPHAGCDPEELARFIKGRIQEERQNHDA